MKEIPNYSNYLASEQGQIYSKNYKRTRKMKILKHAPDANGYFRTVLKNDNGKYVTVKVHQIIASAFIGIRPKGLVVNHKDGNKQNNRPSNLEYCTISQNIKHAFDNGLMKPKKGQKNGMSKLTFRQVVDIKTHIKNHPGRYYGRKKLAKTYNVSAAAIKDIAIGRTWSHVNV